MGSGGIGRLVKHQLDILMAWGMFILGQHEDAEILKSVDIQPHS